MASSESAMSLHTNKEPVYSKETNSNHCDKCIRELTEEGEM
jgi:hypothetical protein